MKIIALEEPYIYGDVNGLAPVWFLRIIETPEDYLFVNEMTEEWIRYITPKKIWEEEDLE